MVFSAGIVSRKLLTLESRVALHVRGSVIKTVNTNGSITILISTPVLILTDTVNEHTVGPQT